MPASKAKNLSSLFRSAIKTASKIFPSLDAPLKHFVSSLDTSSSSSSSSSSTTSNLKRSIKFPKSPSRSKNSPPSKSATLLAVESLKFDSAPHLDESTQELSKEISSILLDGSSLDTAISLDSRDGNDDKPEKSLLEIPWFSSMSHNNISLRRKEVSRDRKQKWIFKSGQTHRFDRLVRMCAQKLGADATIKVFGRLGRETGVKEYNALIGLCIEEARKTEDEEVSLQQISKAYKLFKSMKQLGFQLEDETYGPFLMFLIDMEMVQEFVYFCEAIYQENPNSLSRLAYYEMMLWIRVNNEDKITELCDYILTNDDGDKPNFKESYLLALCESDRKKELLLLLQIIDITEISLGHLPNIFRSLGRLLLESFVKKFILELKSCGADIGAENTSDFIYNYAISMPNLAGFWCGNVLALLMVMPYTAIQFTVLHKLKTFATGSSKTEDHIHLSPYLSYISGALAGCATTLILMDHAIMQSCTDMNSARAPDRMLGEVRGHSSRCMASSLVRTGFVRGSMTQGNGCYQHRCINNSLENGRNETLYEFDFEFISFKECY